MRDTLLSDGLCAERTLGSRGAFLINTPYGVGVAKITPDEARHYRGEAHFGQLLKVLAETGTPLSTVVETQSGGTATVNDILADAILRYSEAREFEFIGIGLALYLPPTKTWRDQFGVDHDFDGLVTRLISRPFGEGACSGCHAPYTIALILRVDEIHPILSARARREAAEWLRALSRRIESTIHSSGDFVLDWTGPSTTGGPWGDRVLDQITILGHHLEWIAVSPADLRPDRDSIERLIDQQSQSLLELPPLRIRSFKTLLPCSHAARALCLFRGVRPYEAWQQLWEQNLLVRSDRMGFELRGN